LVAAPESVLETQVAGGSTKTVHSRVSQTSNGEFPEVRQAMVRSTPKDANKLARA